MYDFKAAWIAITGGLVASIPDWVSNMADWAQVLAQIGGFLAVFFGLIRMVDQFFLKRKGIDLLNRQQKDES
jgi:cytosine/uracil/thiamine/allantoin permease